MTTTVDSPAASVNEPAEGTLEFDLARIRKADRRELRVLAEHIVREKHHLRLRIAKAEPFLKQMQEGLAALTAPEMYSVIITAVSVQGSRTVQVAGLNGNARMEIAVHPSIDPQDLRVGHRGLVTRERNCLYRVLGPNTQWTDIGTFEDYLDGGRRLLVQCQGHWTAVTMSEQLERQLAGAPLRKGDLLGFDREPTGLAYARLDPPGREQLFRRGEELPEDRFSDLGGLEKPILQLKRAVDLRFKHNDVAARYGLGRKRGFLLSGPPGNGKTRLARCLAAYAGEQAGRRCKFMAISAAQDYQMWLGESERRIRERFAAIRDAAGEGELVVVFHDEIDAIGLCRSSDRSSSAPDRILNTYLSELDGVARLSNVILVAATNRADRLDPALVRPGRYDITITIPAPTRRGAASIVNSYLRALPLADGHGERERMEIIEAVVSAFYSPNGPYRELAQVKLSDGRLLSVGAPQLISGALLENAVQVAAEEAGWREIEHGTPGITEEDLRRAIAEQLFATAGLLTAANVKAYVRAIPEESHPVAVRQVMHGE